MGAKNPQENQIHNGKGQSTSLLAFWQGKVVKRSEKTSPGVPPVISLFWKAPPRLHKQCFCQARKPPLHSAGHLWSEVHPCRPVRVGASFQGVLQGWGACVCICGFSAGCPSILREGLILDSRATNPWVKSSCFVATDSQVTFEMHLEMDRGRGLSNRGVL